MSCTNWAVEFDVRPLSQLPSAAARSQANFAAADVGVLCLCARVSALKCGFVSQVNFRRCLELVTGLVLFDVATFGRESIGNANEPGIDDTELSLFQSVSHQVFALTAKASCPALSYGAIGPLVAVSIIP